MGVMMTSFALDVEDWLFVHSIFLPALLYFIREVSAFGNTDFFKILITFTFYIYIVIVF